MSSDLITVLPDDLPQRGEVYRDLHKKMPERYRRAYEMPEGARKWADRLIGGSSDVTNLVLSGSIGVGKTHSAIAVACYLGALWDYCLAGVSFAHVRYSPSYLAASDLAEFVKRRPERHSYNEPVSKRGDQWDIAVASSVLVLDDFARSTTEFDIELFTRLLDIRLRTMLPTVLTTNSDPDTFTKKIGSALASRALSGSTQLYIVGHDRRNDTRK
jgi:DNA replication protein DnaC